MPIMKQAQGKYVAVLSDNSVDRDEEMLSKSCIEKLSKDDGYLAAFCNHENDVFMQVAEWTNRGITQVDGHTALIAEPKFYKSNPKAMIIKGMLDEGAKFGVSIGAIVKRHDEVNGMRVFEELELLEASFVGIPANKHGRAMAVAKSYKNKEVVKMDKEFTQKDIDSAVEKAKDDLASANKKLLEAKETEISKLKKDAEEAAEAKEEEAKVDAGKAEEAAKEAGEEAEKKLKLAVEKAELAGKEALEKQKFADQGGAPDGTSLSSEDITKAFKDGKLPFVRSQ